MKKAFLIFAAGLVLFTGCEKKKTGSVKPCTVKTEEKGKKEFKMYEMSEMAALMEQMYVDNQRLAARIKNGDTIGRFPSHFLKIHASAMTDETDNDAFFKEQAAKFIRAQELIYKDPENAKEHFNNAVSACVKCHENKCEGPIPRIKKLYIE